MNPSRRKFIKSAGKSVAALSIGGFLAKPLLGFSYSPLKLYDEEKLFFKISLAQWSLNRELFSGKVDNLDFSSIAKKEFDIHAVEYVNQFFKDKGKDLAYLKEMKKRAEDNGVRNVLIMIDGEGNLGEPDDKERTKAVENHYKWVEAAKLLGCHAIRVNAGASRGSEKEVMDAAVQGLGKLTEFGSQHGISVIVENHGGYSSDGRWLSEVMAKVNNTRCGTLPDFGNFCIKSTQKNGEHICEQEYDKYKGVEELMPYAKGVSAKTYAFDGSGNESSIDYRRMLKIIHKAGYTGHIGIEFEGKGDAYEGIRATKQLLLRLGKEFS